MPTSKKAKQGAELLAAIDEAGLAPPKKPLHRAAETLPPAIAPREHVSRKAQEGAALLAEIEKSAPTKER